MIPPAIGDFPAGARIGSYRIEELIGRGGMATVYRATDERLDRQVALKVLVPELTRDEAFRQRFIRESRSGAAVDHPNVIPVFEAGEASGVLFIAMRLVAGQDVRALIEREGRLAPGRVVSIITQIASALDAAHAQGLIHRDVKPANMLLASVGSATRPDHVYLSDFGLSKMSVSNASLTGTGQFLGTLDYMSPEQVEGRPIDGRTDLYALGCAAFEMLTGEPPFRREQNLAVMWAQVSAPPPSVRSLRPELPADVDRVLGKALAKAPENRHGSCLEFAAELRAACSSRSAPGGVPETGAAGQAPGHAPTQAVGLPPVVMPPVSNVTPGFEATVTETGSGLGGAGASGYQPGGAPSYPPAWEGGATGPGQSAAPGQTHQLWAGQTGYQQPRRRSKVMPVLIGLVIVILLGAGAYAALSLRGNGGGTPQGGGGTHTVTKTASPTSSPSVSPSPSQSASPQPTTPAGVVTAYYDAINNQDYREAWRLNKHVHKLQTYTSFKQGFEGTQNVVLTIISVSGDNVNVRFTANQTDGTTKTFQGTYVVQNGTIVNSNIQQIS